MTEKRPTPHQFKINLIRLLDFGITEIALSRSIMKKISLLFISLTLLPTCVKAGYDFDFSSYGSPPGTPAVAGMNYIFTDKLGSGITMSAEYSLAGAGGGALYDTSSFPAAAFGGFGNPDGYSGSFGVDVNTFGPVVDYADQVTWKLTFSAPVTISLDFVDIDGFDRFEVSSDTNFVASLIDSLNGNLSISNAGPTLFSRFDAGDYTYDNTYPSPEQSLREGVRVNLINATSLMATWSSAGPNNASQQGFGGGAILVHRTAVPEPGTFVLLFSLIPLALIRRKRA